MNQDLDSPTLEGEPAEGAQTIGEAQPPAEGRYVDWQWLYRSGQLDGYKQGSPPGTSAEKMASDRAAAETPCRCGAGREYRPFHEGPSYRFFALCRQCGLCEEFKQ